MFLARVIKKNPNKEKDRFDAIYENELDGQLILTTKEDDNSDTLSIDSFSTTATMDNIPGTGRALDMYFFQPAGRRIERFAMRLSIRYLHPTRITAYISRDVNSPWGTMLDVLRFWLPGPLNDVLRAIDLYTRNGSTVIAGLKSLVRQAK